MNCLRDLQRREYESAGGVKDDVERDVVVRHLDRAQHLLRVVDVDVARDGEAQKPHRLLPVHEQNDAGISSSFQGPKTSPSPGFTAVNADRGKLLSYGYPAVRNFSPAKHRLLFLSF